MNVKKAVFSSSEPEVSNMFPRLGYFKLHDTIITTHLDIFDQFRPLFSAFLEMKEGIGSSNLLSKSMQYKKNIHIPNNIKLERWRRMSLTE